MGSKRTQLAYQAPSLEYGSEVGLEGKKKGNKWKSLNAAKARRHVTSYQEDSKRQLKL